MSTYTLHKVETKSDVRKFLKVAVTINSHDSNWVQPLDNDIESVFDPKRNELFDNGEAIRWILNDPAGNAVGRIAAFYNKNVAAKEAQLTGGCGFFECIDNQEAANTLFDAAAQWLRERGMEAMDGSINFGDRMSWWGVLAEGFTLPLYSMNYNPPYYCALFEAYGFENYFNQYVYLRSLSDNVKLNSVLLEKAERLSVNPDYDFRIFEMNDLPKMANDFMRVYNSGWAKFDGVNPLTLDHAMAMVKTMKPILDPEIVYFAYYKDEPVGFFVMVPDLNQVIQDFKGKFGIVNKLRLLLRLKGRKHVDRLSGIVFGVAAEQQGKGVEAGLIRQFELYTERKRAQGKEQYTNLEMMWVGDFNPVMMRMCESYVNATKHKRFVTYRYLFDRDKLFTRCPRLGAKPKTVKNDGQ